jgi:hypothetical protein
MKHLYRIGIVSLLIVPHLSTAGVFVEDGFVSNLVPPSPRITNPLDQRRLFTIYLPDGYATSTERYPVIYYCPGLGGNDQSFNAGNKLILDRLISGNLMVPTLVVHMDPSLISGTTPSGTQTYEGSWYVNSALNGQFETYITTQLIPYVDANYRTKASAGFRAIMGQSMGGFGSVFLGTRHPELFCGFASAGGTSLWDIVTDLASPGYPEMTLNSLIIPELIAAGTGKVAPGNGTSSFLVFSIAAALSPNLSGDTPFAAEYFVDMPFQVNPDGTPVLVSGTFVVGNVGTPCNGQFTVPYSLVLDPTVIAQWQTFDPYLLMDATVPTLARQAIYLDGGTTESIVNVGARLLSDKYSASAIDHEYILYIGSHVRCLDDPKCSRHQTIFQLFSAKFAEAGNAPNDIRTKLVGTGSINIQNGTWDIAQGTIVGIETSPSLGVSATNIAIMVGDNGTIQIGTQTTPGGALQVGDNFGKAILNGNPALLNNTVSNSLTIDGTDALVQLGKQAFFGLGVGINGQAPSVPNFWSVSRLASLQNAELILTQGTFAMNQVPNGQDTGASLFAIGPSASYSLNMDPSQATLRSGSSQVVGPDVWQLHPTLLNTTGLLPPSGILVNLDTDPDAVDCFYIQPMGSTVFYMEALTRGVNATSAQYDDRGFLNNYSFTTASINAFSNFLRTTSYIDQLSKEAALIVESDADLAVAYLDNGIINIVPVEEAPVGTDGVVNFQGIAQTSGTVGIWVETVNGNRELILVYDIDPA